MIAVRGGLGVEHEPSSPEIRLLVCHCHRSLHAFGVLGCIIAIYLGALSTDSISTNTQWLARRLTGRWWLASASFEHWLVLFVFATTWRALKDIGRTVFLVRSSRHSCKQLGSLNGHYCTHILLCQFSTALGTTPKRQPLVVYSADLLLPLRICSSSAKTNAAALLGPLYRAATEQVLDVGTDFCYC